MPCRSAEAARAPAPPPDPAPLLARLVADATLEAAYAWLCAQRRDWPAAADIWDFRRHWPAEKARLTAELLAGTFRFQPLHRATRADGETVEVWAARDALVLKALALVVGPQLPVAPRCVHVKGHGGLKGAVRQVAARLKGQAFVLRTDVQDYYASIDHGQLQERLAGVIPEKPIRRLLWQHLRRTVEWGGLYRDIQRGVARGSPLSPLLGAFFLGGLDAALARLPVFAVRFMDDILVLAPTRWRLRRAVQVVNRTLGALGLEKHPAKTCIGRVAKGFEFLGYRFGPGGLVGLARATRERFVARAARLYERERAAPSPGASPLGRYVRRFTGWACGGLAGALSDGRGGWGRLTTGALLADPSNQGCARRE